MLFSADSVTTSSRNLSSNPSSRVLQRFVLAIIVLVVVVGGLLLEYQQTVSCQVVIHPQRRWTLTEENPGVLLSRTEDLITGRISHYQLFQFDRPAFLEIEFPLDAAVPTCSVGDVMALARSSSLILEEAKQERALSQARAHLEALKVGAKPASIAEGKLSIKRAETDLATFGVQYERQKALRQQEIISDADLDELEAHRKLLIMDVALAKAELEVRLAGADPGQISEAEALIPELQQELDIIREMLASLTILSPLAGRVGFGANDPSLLLEVTPLDSMAVKLFIPLDEVAKISEGTNFIVRMAGQVMEPAISGTLVRIDGAVQGDPAGAFITGAGVCLNPDGALATGMRGTAYLDCGKTRVWKLVYNSVKQTLQREFPTM